MTRGQLRSREVGRRSVFFVNGTRFGFTRVGVRLCVCASYSIVQYAAMSARCVILCAGIGVWVRQ